MIFLNAVNKFCSEVIRVRENHYTYEGRPLYEVSQGKVHKKCESLDIQICSYRDTNLVSSTYIYLNMPMRQTSCSYHIIYIIL